MPETTQQLKGDIDAGRMGDKVPGWDPGLSPLGTDDEAAGTPNTPEQVAVARTQGKRGAPRPPPEQAAHPPQPSLAASWIIAGAFVLVLLALALALWQTRG